MAKTVISILVLLCILAFGSLGYMLIEGASFSDGLYMTVITVSTVGFSETMHLSPGGRFFTILLIFVGVGYVMVLFREITESVVVGGVQNIIGKRKMTKQQESLKDHYVICGFGRIGQVICKILQDNGRNFVVIEKDEGELSEIEELGYLAIQGNATHDNCLIKAGVERARGLIAVVASDADNVYISLSARGLNPDLYIIARSSGDERAELKLKQAGADQVISPYYIGAHRMANLIIRPTVVDFVDIETHSGNLGLRLEEIFLAPGASFVGKTIKESVLKQEADIMVVLIKGADGSSCFNPAPDRRLEDGETLVVLGNVEDIAALERLIYANN
ncbi:MAG: potassium channel protein [Thermodesulfobacteriota bacterium]